MSSNQELQREFNRWARAGRGEQMQEHHQAIALATMERMELHPRDRILDLGCGIGWASRRLAERVPLGRVLGVDIADEMVLRAQSHALNPSHVQFQKAGADNLPFPESTFDKVFSCESFYYYPDLTLALEEIFRVLVPAGKFFCLVNLFKENPYTHAWVELLKVKVHLLGAAEYESLWAAAGFVEVSTARIPDQTRVDEANFKPGWGVHSIEDLRRFREIGALLVVGTKPVLETLGDA